MLRFITAVLGVFLLMQSAFAETARPETGKYVQAYRGQEGAVVWLMRIGPRAANEALVQVSHIDNDIDGRIFRCKVQMTRDGEKSYTADIKGKPFELVRIKDGNGSLYIPDEQSTWWINYNEELSNGSGANAEHFLTAYLEQETKKQ
ncbi:hypothetical protein [Pseudocitrobacter cyperus]|uniref:DUF4367 domain-containing protein n=1 Tax=Pseudocitrobacter cyperus TaxID=3112843 RepID=A0ABV0HGC2_9ENTR